MGYLLEIAKKVQTREKKLSTSYNELNELNELTSSLLVKNAQTQDAGVKVADTIHLKVDADVSWTPEVQLLVDWFLTHDPPAEPFYLQDHLRIVDPVKFFEKLRREIEVGPRGPRARMGTLQGDLRNLKTFLAE